MSRRLKISPRVIPPLPSEEKKSVAETVKAGVTTPRRSPPKSPRRSPLRTSLKAAPRSPRKSPPRTSPKRTPPKWETETPDHRSRAQELVAKGELKVEEAVYYAALERNDFAEITDALRTPRGYKLVVIALKVYLEHNLLNLKQMRFFTALDPRKYGAEADHFRDWVAGWGFLYKYWKAGADNLEADMTFTYIVNEVWDHAVPEEIYEQLDDLIDSLPNKITQADVPFFQDIHRIFWFEGGAVTDVIGDLLRTVQQRAVSFNVYREIAAALRRS